MGHSLQWERGLKYLHSTLVIFLSVSFPVVGTYIKIVNINTKKYANYIVHFIGILLTRETECGIILKCLKI